MKKLLLFVAAFFFLLIQGKSQSFYQVYHAPLLLNPSFAGSTGVPRLNIISNLGTIKSATSNIKPFNYNEERMSNHYCSFDHLIKKWGLGIGGAVYSSGSNYNSRTIENNLGGLISVAPKFVINKRNGTSRGTISPSVGFGYSASNDKSSWHYSPFRKEIRPSYYEIPKYVKGEIFDKMTIVTVGLLYNSPKLILGLSVSNKSYQKTFEVHRQTNETIWYLDDTRIYEKEMDFTTKGNFQIFDFHVSKVFKISENSKLSIVPSLNSSIAFERKKEKDYNKFLLYGFNTSIQLLYGKVHFGTVIDTGLPAYTLFAGYRKEKFKITVTVRLGNNRADYIMRAYELGVAYNFKKKM